MSQIGLVPSDARVVVLYKHNAADELIACEPVEFCNGAPAIDTALRRAQISGRVLIGGDLQDYFADLRDTDGNTVESVALDQGSYRALKTRWMRTRLARTGN